MARIAGVDLPPRKRAEIGLTYIYGIGRTRAKSLLHRVGVDPDTKIRDLTRRGSQQHPYDPRKRRRRRRRSPQGNLDEHQAAHRNGFLSRFAAPPRPAGSRPAHPHQRAHPQGSAPRHRGQQEESRREVQNKHGESTSKEHEEEIFQEEREKHIPVGVVHVQATFNNTIVTFTDPIGNVLSWSSSGSLGFRGSRKGTPFAAQQASLDGRQQGEGSGMRSVEVRVAVRGRPRIGRSRACRRRALKFASIRDVTPIPHNGCRPPKKRRV